jgi:hypothetical protein
MPDLMRSCKYSYRVRLMIINGANFDRSFENDLQELQSLPDHLQIVLSQVQVNEVILQPPWPKHKDGQTESVYPIQLVISLFYKVHWLYITHY